jgi:eukaryotic-like serine/threonine-protein kinase
MNVASAAEPIRTIGRYALFDEIASGGMATVHLGRLLGPVGFSRTVAIKRLHTHFAKDPEFSAGFVDEARLAARIHHPNVVPIIDVLHDEGELSLVMDYVEGDSLAKLLRIAASTDVEVPLPIVTAIVCGALYGLHAAHEAVDESGEPMHIVHRDISPQNILVGSDGVPRILDFGVAKAAQRLQTTADGQVKGKIAYMAPEQIRQAAVSRQTDVYAMGVVLWEALAGKRLFTSENHANLMSKVLSGAKLPPSSLREDCPPALDALVMRALSLEPRTRFETAREMAAHIQRVLPPAPPTDVGDWVNALARDALTDRRRVVKRVESRELPAEGKSAEDFISRPNHEDLLTVVDRGRRFSDEDGTAQAVTTGRMKARVESSRIFLPLVLGLAMVTAVIVTLLVRSRPTLENPGQPSASPSVSTASPRQSSKQEDLPEKDLDSPEDATTAVKPPEPIIPSDPDPEPTQATRTTKRRAPTAPPPSSTSCPKFIEDEQGIQRINRKCWQ